MHSGRSGQYMGGAVNFLKRPAHIATISSLQCCTVQYQSGMALQNWHGSQLIFVDLAVGVI